MVQSADWELLERYRRYGDELAFEALVQRHGPMVMAVCRRRLGTQGDSDDAFQAVLIVLARRASTLTDRRPLGAWLYGVAVRVTEAARQRRARQERLKHSAPTPGSKAETPAHSPESLESVLPIIDREVERLSEKLRLSFVMCCVENQSHAEAAAALGCTADAVRGRVAQARKRLRANLTRLGVSATLGLLLMERLRAFEPSTQAVMHEAAVASAKAAKGLALVPTGVAQLAGAGMKMSWPLLPVAVAAMLLLAPLSWAIVNVLQSATANAAPVPSLPATPVSVAQIEKTGAPEMAASVRNDAAEVVAAGAAANAGAATLPAPQPVEDGTGNLLQAAPLRFHQIKLCDAAALLQKTFNVSMNVSPAAQEALAETVISLGPNEVELTGFEFLTQLAAKSHTEIKIQNGAVYFVLKQETVAAQGSGTSVKPPKPDEF